MQNESRGNGASNGSKDTEAEQIEIAEYEIKRWGNKSRAIRGLVAEGMQPAEIARRLMIRYQHVRNVMGQVLKREVKKEREASRAREALEKQKTELEQESDNDSQS